MAYTGAGYPRAWTTEHPPRQSLLGLWDVCELVGVTRATGSQWVRLQRLPPADGPDINGQPTWTRELILVWMYMRSTVPIHHLREATDVMNSPGVQRLVEMAVTVIVR